MRRLQSLLPELRREFGVQRIGLFGSALSDRFREDSDVDLIVELERPLGYRFVELAERLCAELDRRVDLLTPAGVNAIRSETVASSIRESTRYV